MNAEDLDTTLKKNMAKLSKSERRRAIETVRDIIRSAMYDDAAGSGFKIERCPRCGSVAIVKKGKSRSGEQRSSSATTAGRFLAPPTGSSARASCYARPGWPMLSASSSCSRSASVLIAAASASGSRTLVLQAHRVPEGICARVSRRAGAGLRAR